MNVRILFLAGGLLSAAGLLSTGVAQAEDTAAAAAPAATAPADAPAKASTGQKEWKERINVVARNPHDLDIAYLDSRDRTGWRDFSTWQGVRDERPIIARKTAGFHAPYPHRSRAERVLLIGRGPLRGPAPTE